MSKPADTDISIAFLRECFDLDLATGILTWRVRPRDHFATARGWRQRNGRFAGKVAGSVGHGYLHVRITVGGRHRLVRAHRIVFAFVRGRWPDEEVDHKNRKRSENSPDNLRDATRRENSQNGGVRRNNKSGFLGVAKNGQRWGAFIKVNYRSRNLGTFDTPEAAHARYLQAKAELHPFQPTPRN